MAMNKDDYTAQGRTDAHAGKPRMALRAGNWQAAAYDKGYDDALAFLAKEAQANGDTMVEEDVKIDTTKMEFTRIDNLGDHDAFVDDLAALSDRARAAWEMPARPIAVDEHIKCLREDAATCTDIRRKHRLLAKAVTLIAKWNRA